jgi:hypothetical protein
VLEGLPRAALAEGRSLRRVGAAAQLAQQLVVVGRVHHHGHVGMVLGGGTDHGGPADVDVLHRHLSAGAWWGGGWEVEGWGRRAMSWRRRAISSRRALVPHAWRRGR